MSIQSVRPVAVGLPAPAAQIQPTQSTSASRSAVQARKVRNPEDENVFSPPGVMSRLTRSLRADDYIRVDAVSRGSELAATKGYPSDTVVQAVASQIVSI
jgi:hypothetical protein